MSRAITHRYEDPLDRVWLDAAARIGLDVERSAGCYASTDGRGHLIIGTRETLDADDCLAQLILHELCHSLIQGLASFEAPDWGLDNETDRDLPREHACLRLQAWLAARHGLRSLLAPTTDHRAFYDALGEDPLDSSDPSAQMARIGAVRARCPPWAPHLGQAMAATETIARAIAGIAGNAGETDAEPTAAGPRTGPAAGLRASLWTLAKPAQAHHPTGLRTHRVAVGTCGDCAWQRVGGRGRAVSRCRQLDDARVEPDWPACERFERAVDCLRCGACCREAYDAVEVGARDPFVRRHPDLLERADGRLSLRRVAGRCPPLRGEGTARAPYRCAVYEDRPRTCRDFERGGASCLEARRRVGLSL